MTDLLQKWLYFIPPYIYPIYNIALMLLSYGVYFPPFKSGLAWRRSPGQVNVVEIIVCQLCQLWAWASRGFASFHSLMEPCYHQVNDPWVDCWRIRGHVEDNPAVWAETALDQRTNITLNMRVQQDWQSCLQLRN